MKYNLNLSFQKLKAQPPLYMKIQNICCGTSLHIIRRFSQLEHITVYARNFKQFLKQIFQIYTKFRMHSGLKNIQIKFRSDCT